jgi:predicted acetyltransferase
MDQITLYPALLEDKPVFENLMNLYLYDFTEYTGEDADQQGRFMDEYLEKYWVEPNRFPFLVKIDGKYAGFVLVRDTLDIATEEVVHILSEFFVMRKYRRQKVGRQMAFQIFDRFPGRWYVSQEENNLPAQIFWRKVIGEYTSGQYQEFLDAQWNRPYQMFRTPGSPLDKFGH